MRYSMNAFLLTALMVSAAMSSSSSFATGSDGAKEGAEQAFKLEFSAEDQQRIASTMAQATEEMKQGLEKLRPKLEAAKTEAEKNVYYKAVALMVENLIYRGVELDLELARKVPEWSNSIKAEGYPTLSTAVRVGEPIVVGAIGTSLALGTANKLLVGPFKAVLGAVGSHFARKDIGFLGKILLSPVIPIKAFGNLLVLGTTIVADSVLVYYAGIHAYGAIVSSSKLEALIKANEARLQRTQDELSALDLSL